MTGCKKTIHSGLICGKPGLYLVLLVMSLISIKSLFSQQLKVYNLNTSQFPDITANFALYGENGEFIYDLQQEEVWVKEDSLNREIIEFYNPSRNLLHSSIILMLDISRSMTGERLQILKEAATSFIDTLPLDITEVAVGTFNDEVYLNSDFTQKSDRLKRTIQMIETDGETDYNNAFLNRYSGAIDIARHGFYKKKIIIFLTDGMAGAHVAEIISKALSENISVYCITVKLKMPYVLKKIAEETGGEWFEEINTYDMTKDIYSRIFEHAQSSTFGYIRWRSQYTCNSSVKLKLSFRGTSVSLSYDIPQEKQGRLEAGSSSLYFSDMVPGKRNDVTALFEAKNIPITITGILNHNPEYFDYEQHKFPFIIPEDDSFKMKFYYLPADSGIRTNQYTISTKECGDILMNAFGGSENRIKLLHPAGGELFVPGMDTSILWEGVEENINIMLTLKNESTGDAWLPIANSSGWRYSWNVPVDTGTKIRVKASTLAELNYKSDLLIRTRISSDNKPLFSANYGPDGNEIYTCDSSGIIKVWKEGNGQLIKTLDRRSLGYVAYIPEYDRIVSLSESGIGIFTNRTGMHIGHVGSPGKRLYTSILSYNGKEFYSTATQEFYSVTPLDWKTGKNAGIWDPLQKTFLNLPPNRNYQEAAFSASRLYAITLVKDNLLIWNTIRSKKIRKIEIPSNFRSAIFNPSKNILSINNRNGVTIFDIDKNKNLMRIPAEEYVRFSPGGSYVVTRRDSMLNIRNMMNAIPVRNIEVPQFIKFTTDEDHALYSCKDTVIILNLKENSIHFRKYCPNLINASLNQSEDRILLYHTNSIEIINWLENRTLFYAVFQENDFRSFVFSPRNENILSITRDNEAVIWRPNIKTSADSSGYFTIISPKPLVKDTICFGKRDLNKPMETVVNDYLENNTKFPLKIVHIQINDDNSHEFDIVSELPPYSIDSFSAREIELRFIPRDTGMRFASMIVFTPGDSFKTVLAGTGMVHKFEIPPKMVDFGSLEVFKEKDTIVTIFRNPEKDTIYITGIENSGPDTEQFRLLTRHLIQNIPPQRDLRLNLKFAPRNRGRTNGNIKLKMKDSNDEIDVRLFGEGEAPSSILIYGRTLESSDSIPLEASVKCIDLLTRRITVDTLTRKEGIFSFYLRPDRRYALVAEKEGYISSSENIDLDRVMSVDSINKDVFLTRIRDNAIVKLNNIFFEFARADLLETSFSDLNRILNLLHKRKEIRIEIHGHTDDIGSSESNINLGWRRALAVKNYLILKGISENRLETLSFGESKPVATNLTDEGRQLNRRVEIKIIGDPSHSFKSY